MESRHDSENADRILFNIQFKQLVCYLIDSLIIGSCEIIYINFIITFLPTISVPDMTYNVFGGTLSLTQSINQSANYLRCN